MATLQIRDKVKLTLPTSFRKKYRLNDGTKLTLIDLDDGSFNLTRGTSKVMKSADKVGKIVKEANVSLEDMLNAL